MSSQPPSPAIRAPMHVLLLDTCGTTGSVALSRDATIIQQAVFEGRAASETLFVAINDLLRRAQLSLQDLDAIAVVCGPGSFTGVRIGLAAAKALAEAVPLPLVAVSRLEVLGHVARELGDNRILLLASGPAEFFWARMEGSSITGEGLAKLDELEDLLSKGQVPVICEEGAVPPIASHSALTVAALRAGDALEIVRARLAANMIDDPLLLDALYMHRTEADILARQRISAQRKQERAEKA